MGTLTAVWPLEADIEGGVHPQTYAEATLTPFVKGWMTHADAATAVAAGTVQIMVGETPESLHRIPVCASATIRAASPDVVELAFQEPVALDNETGFSVAGSVAATEVSSSAVSGKVLSLTLDDDVLATETLVVTYDDDSATSDLTSADDADLLAANFVITANFIG